MRRAFVIAPAILLIACTPETTPDPAPETTLPFFGDGYRAEGDMCRRLGESPETAEFLDDAADLVGCPEDMENLGVFITETNAQEVFRQDGFIVFTVPVR